MSVGDWREGEGRTGGRGEHPSSPGPSYSPITKAPSPSAPNNTPIVSFHQAHPNSPHDQSPRPTFTPSITNMCCSNMRYGHHSQKHQRKKLGDVEKNILCEMLLPPFRIWFYGPQVPVLHAYISFTENASFTNVGQKRHVLIFFFETIEFKDCSYRETKSIW